MIRVLGNAIAAGVASIDPAAVRNTQDVNILLRRADLADATKALEAIGFVHRNDSGTDMFLDGANASVRDAIHVIPAAEKIRPDYSIASPDVSESTATDQFRLLQLEALVKMKLTSFCRKDQVHLLDLLGVGLIEATWPARLPSELGARLQQLLDTPDN
jgi:hypothetical protein